MHAARWLQQGPATGLPPNNIRTSKVDRLDLLARVINLRADCVAEALAPSSAAAHERSGWADLFDQAEDLGKQWANSDPTDATRLLPSLLPGLQRVAERFERGYNDAVRVGPYVEQAGDIRECAPRLGVCGICETDVTLLLQAITTDESLIACPCCGEAWQA